MFGSYFATKVRGIQDGLVKAIVAFDPEGATEAQLLEYKKQVDQLAAETAKAGQRAEADEKLLAEKGAEVERFRAAIRATKAKADAGEKGQDAVLEKLLEKGEEVKSQLAGLEETAKDSRGWYEECKAAHKAAVDKWTKGRERLEKAKRDMERAREEERRAEQQRKDRERVMGLSGGLDKSDIAMSAMEAQAAASRQRAAASKLTADALGAKQGVDADVEKALREATAPAAPSRSAAERAAEF